MIDWFAVVAFFVLLVGCQVVGALVWESLRDFYKTSHGKFIAISFLVFSALLAYGLGWKP